MKLISKGEKNRAIRKTIMNAKSSRSHTILKITIEAYDTDQGKDVFSVVIFLNFLESKNKLVWSGWFWENKQKWDHGLKSFKRIKKN